jgi:hypothetical protein
MNSKKDSAGQKKGTREMNLLEAVKLLKEAPDIVGIRAVGWRKVLCVYWSESYGFYLHIWRIGSIPFTFRMVDFNEKWVIA